MHIVTHWAQKVQTVLCHWIVVVYSFLHYFLLPQEDARASNTPPSLQRRSVSMYQPLSPVMDLMEESDTWQWLTTRACHLLKEIIVYSQRSLCLQQPTEEYVNTP